MSTDRSPRFFLVCIACVAAFHAQAQATELRLGSASLSLSLDSELDYCLTSLSREGGSDAPLAIPTAQRSLSPWLIRVRRGNGRYADLVAGDAGVVSHSRKAQPIAVHWRDVTSRGMGGALQVTMTVRLDGTSGKSRWRLQVDGDIAGVLWWVEFPRVFGVRGKGNGRLAMPHYWGRLLRDPIGLRARRSLTYPSPGSMQFMAFWQEAEGAVPPSPPELGVAESGWLAGVGTSPGLYWARSLED